MKRGLLSPRSLVAGLFGCNYAWVARRFELSRRRDTLSFGHHAELAALREPEQGSWLDQAQTGRRGR